MRRLRWLALPLAAIIFVSCGPIRPADAPAVSVVPTISEVATMRVPPDPTQTATPAAEATPSPSLSPSPSQIPSASPTVSPSPSVSSAAPEDFDGWIASGLRARWAGGQAVVVRAKRGGGAEAEMWLYEREGGQWKIAAGPWPAVVGRNGVGKRAEGEGKSPSGAYLLGSGFGTATAPGGVKFPYQKLDKSDRWIDDSDSPFYNRWVRGSASVCGGGEDLPNVKQYKYAVALHYNDEAKPGAGSAIFLHVWKDPGRGTAGCTAVSEEHMVALLKWLDYSKRPVLAQGTEEELARLMGEDWGILCLPAGWGFADDFIPDAQLEIRYNTDNNFTGRRIKGYAASLAPMRMEAIEALSRAAVELRKKGLGIRVYDAYRPQTATDAMIAWAEDASDTATKEAYYPGIDKTDIPGNYVARKSAHRLGGTVDLTLLDWKTGRNLDMGGPFDFFGGLSAFGYKGLTRAQSANRALLRNTMTKHGFKPYDAEWWHFTASVGGSSGDFLIIPREHVIQS